MRLSSPRRPISVRNANTENVPTTVLNAEAPGYASTRKSRVRVSYVRVRLFVSMVSINNTVMIAEQSVSVNMANVAVAVKSV